MNDDYARLNAIRKLIHDGYLDTAHNLLIPMQDIPEARELLRDVIQEKHRKIENATHPKEIVLPEKKRRAQAFGTPVQTVDFGNLTTVLNIVAVIAGVVFIGVIVVLTLLDQHDTQRDDSIRATIITARTLESRMLSRERVGASPSATNHQTKTPSGANSAPLLSTQAGKVTFNPGVVAVVTEVTGVDSFEVEIENAHFQVVYIGVVGPSTEAGCYNTALRFHTELLKGKTVRLVRDSTDIDNSGRLPRYVFLEESMINSLLLRAGYGVLLPHPPDNLAQTELERAAAEALQRKTGCYRDGGFEQAVLDSTSQPSEGTCLRVSCRDFTSRQELNDYVLQCPNDRWKFDRDNDGQLCWRQSDLP